MPPTLDDRLHHILQAIVRIETIPAGYTLQWFAGDDIVRLATERLLEIVSEASRHVPDVIKNDPPHIPWRRMADLGNQLRHGYDGIEPERIWIITQRDLDPLKAVIDGLAKNIRDDSLK